MHLLVPSNSKQLIERARWFKKPIARRLADEKGVQFGFELKGKPEEIKKAPPLFWGYHLPEDFATEWYYHPEQRKHLLSRISHISFLKPNYVVMHGIHLLWQPPARNSIYRYVNHSAPEEYLKVLAANVELIKILKNIVLIKIENFPLTDYYQKDGHYLPYTMLYTGTGRLNDLLYLKDRTGVDILCDVEHLEITLNFLNRQKNYHRIPQAKEDRTPNDIEKIFGFNIVKGQIPGAAKEIKLAEMIEKIGAKYYHLTGSSQDVVTGKKITGHGPIKKDDKNFRQKLQLVLAQKPEALIIETASRQDYSCYHYLRPNETELSFYSLCEILLEEM